jgi:peptidoglycan L-alanyl-D-glutamate endopeptidase CwlK
MISDRSRKALAGVHPDLVRVIERADEMGGKFTVVCGLRTKAEQELLVKAGKSKTLKSRHLTGHAVDLVDDKFTWGEREMADLAFIVKAAAADCRIPIEWGGDWKSFIDTPHFQLPAAQYPDGEVFEPAPAVETAASAQPAVKPLTKSGTMWGSFGTAVAGVGVYLEQSFSALVDAAAKWSEIGPARDMLANVAGNGKALSLGLLAGCVALIVSRRVKASQEGKAG